MTAESFPHGQSWLPGGRSVQERSEYRNAIGIVATARQRDYASEERVTLQGTVPDDKVDVDEYRTRGTKFGRRNLVGEDLASIRWHALATPTVKTCWRESPPMGRAVSKSGLIRDSSCSSAEVWRLASLC